jgi:D-methionine transport system permease protein
VRKSVPDRVVFGILNVVVNTFRPIPFIILLAAVQPSRAARPAGIGVPFAIFAITIASLFAISRIVEQNLLTVRPASSRRRARRSEPVADPVPPGPRESLGPLVLGYTFVVVALVDMTAMAGAIAAGGLGEFAINYGFKQFNPWVTWSAVLVIVVIVQLVQFVGNARATRPAALSDQQVRPFCGTVPSTR